MQIGASCCKNSNQIGSFVINGFFCPFLSRGLLSIFSGVFHVCFSAEECLPCVIHPLPFFSKVVLVNESIVWLPATRISPLEIKQVRLSLLWVIACFCEIIRSLRGNVQDFIMLCWLWHWRYMIWMRALWGKWVDFVGRQTWVWSPAPPQWAALRLVVSCLWASVSSRVGEGHQHLPARLVGKVVLWLRVSHWGHPRNSWCFGYRGHVGTFSKHLLLFLNWADGRKQ